MADDRDRRDTDRVPALLDADMPEADTAPHSIAELEETAREQRIAMSAAHHAVGLLAKHIMEIFDTQRRIESKIDGFQSSVDSLRRELHDHIAGRERTGNGLSDTEFPSGNG